MSDSSTSTFLIHSLEINHLWGDYETMNRIGDTWYYKIIGGGRMDACRQKNALDFLLYSYFGITSDSEKEELSNAALEKAYFDATQQGAFNTLVPKGKRESARKAYDEALKVLKGKLENCAFDNYAEWHHSTCEDVCKKYKEQGLNCFTYGNAQKWVNMTMKYLYLFDSLGLKNRPIIIDEAKAKCLHVPVDSYIIESVWDKNVELPLIKEKLLKDRTKGKYNNEKVKAWSKWEDNEYQIFQKSLRKALNEESEPIPIDWEGPAWIKQAKDRKQKK